MWSWRSGTPLSVILPGKNGFIVCDVDTKIPPETDRCVWVGGRKFNDDARTKPEAWVLHLTVVVVIYLVIPARVLLGTGQHFYDLPLTINY
jgi:hypothetical protein